MQWSGVKDYTYKIDYYIYLYSKKLNYIHQVQNTPNGFIEMNTKLSDAIKKAINETIQHTYEQQ